MKILAWNSSLLIMLLGVGCGEQVSTPESALNEDDSYIPYKYEYYDRKSATKAENLNPIIVHQLVNGVCDTLWTTSYFNNRIHNPDEFGAQIKKIEDIGHNLVNIGNDMSSYYYSPEKRARLGRSNLLYRQKEVAGDAYALEVSNGDKATGFYVFTLDNTLYFKMPKHDREDEIGGNPEYHWTTRRVPLGNGRFTEWSRRAVIVDGKEFYTGLNGAYPVYRARFVDRNNPEDINAEKSLMDKFGKVPVLSTGEKIEFPQKATQLLHDKVAEEVIDLAVYMSSGEGRVNLERVNSDLSSGYLQSTVDTYLPFLDKVKPSKSLIEKYNSAVAVLKGKLTATVTR